MGARQGGRGEGVEARHRAIRAVLDQGPVASQHELLERLRSGGFEVTQSSVSRDLRCMGVAKQRGFYVDLFRSQQQVGLGAIPSLSSAVIAVAPAGRHLIVVHTPSGLASALCRSIDDARWPEVVGSLAGDDTIFLACRNGSDQKRLLALLRAAAEEEGQA